MNSFMSYRGYLGTVQYSEDDSILHGKLAGISDLVSYDGECIKSLKKCFEDSVDDYLKMCELEGIEPEKTSSAELQRLISESSVRLHNKYIAV